jgi:hypothetical protein
MHGDEDDDNRSDFVSWDSVADVPTALQPVRLAVHWKNFQAWLLAITEHSRSLPLKGPGYSVELRQAISKLRRRWADSAIFFEQQQTVDEYYITGSYSERDMHHQGEEYTQPRDMVYLKCIRLDEARMDVYVYYKEPLVASYVEGLVGEMKQAWEWRPLAGLSERRLEPPIGASPAGGGVQQPTLDRQAAETPAADQTSSAGIGSERRLVTATQTIELVVSNPNSGGKPFAPYNLWLYLQRQDTDRWATDYQLYNNPAIQDTFLEMRKDYAKRHGTVDELADSIAAGQVHRRGDLVEVMKKALVRARQAEKSGKLQVIRRPKDP